MAESQDVYDGKTTTTDLPLVPVRMLNEFVYCPRLSYLMWVQQEFAHNEFTVDGKIRHKRVDAGKAGALPENPDEETTIHARSASLRSPPPASARPPRWCSSATRP
jgi:CRISPR-associated protein Cas1